jgi:para-nitrobenzyl esterase
MFLLIGDEIDRVTFEGLPGVVAAYGLPVEETLRAYQAAHAGASAGDLLAAIQTDWYWRIPAIRLADAHAAKARTAGTYMYEFAWRSPQFDGSLGACHAIEIPFAFDTLGCRTEPLLGTQPPQELANTMHKAWVAFAKNGDCGWAKYDLSQRATMRFETTSKVVDDPYAAARELWDGAKGDWGVDNTFTRAATGA